MQKTIKINPDLFKVGKGDRDSNKNRNKSIKNKDTSIDYRKNNRVKEKILN